MNLKKTAASILLASSLLLGCAHDPSLSDALEAQKLAMGALATKAEALAATWAAKVDARIEFCRGQQLATESERAECMGKYGRGEEIEPDLETLRAGFDQIAEPIPVMVESAKRVEAFLTE
jgi:hypothetical protein